MVSQAILTLLPMKLLSPIFTFFSITEKGPTSTLDPKSAHSAIIAVG